MGIKKLKGRNFWLDIRVRGKRVRRSLGTAEYLLAIERAREITAELRSPRPAGAGIPEFFEKYRAWARETKPSSFRNEDHQLTWIAANLASQGLSTLEEVSPYHVEQMRAAVRARDRRTKPDSPKKGKGTSKATINRYCAVLRSVFNKAIDWGTFHGTNPVSKVKFYREGEKVRPLDTAEVEKVLEAARTISSDKLTSPMGRALYDLCRLVLNTGLRRSEALNLHWADIIDDELRIQGKGGKVRFIPLNGEAQAVLDGRPRLTARVFNVPNQNAPGVLRRVTETIRRKTGVDFHLHLLRHAFASRLMAAGTDIVTVGDLMGHSSSMVSLLYTHSNPILRKRAVLGLQEAYPAPASKTPQRAKSRINPATVDTRPGHRHITKKGPAADLMGKR